MTLLNDGGFLNGSYKLGLDLFYKERTYDLYLVEILPLNGHHMLCI